MLYGRSDSNVNLANDAREGCPMGMAKVISRLMQIWMISGTFLCLFSWPCPRTVESARSSQDAVRGEFMTISNLWRLFRSSTGRFRTWSCSTLHASLPLAELGRSSDLGNAEFAASRGSPRLGKCSSLWFGNSYLTSLRAIPIPGMNIPLPFAISRSTT
jgi:hypothetical protein